MFLHIIPRNIAKERGFVRYFTGELCAKKLHIAERNTSSSGCLACARESARLYRKNNPQKAKESLRKSYLKHADARRSDVQAWRRKNPTKVKEMRARYVQENKEKVASSKRAYYLKNKEALLMASREHYLSNIERYREIAKLWRENNRDRVRLLNRSRKEKIRLAEGSHTIDDINEIKKLQRMTCAACYKKFSGDNYHVDHIFPLSLGGSNDRKNIQLLCPPCNMSKGSKLPEKFYRERGFLL